MRVYHSTTEPYDRRLHRVISVTTDAGTPLLNRLAAVNLMEMFNFDDPCKAICDRSKQIGERGNVRFGSSALEDFICRAAERNRTVKNDFSLLPAAYLRPIHQQD